MTTYIDKTECPKGHRFAMRRRASSAGFVVDTLCAACNHKYPMTAGRIPEATLDLKERDIERRLVRRVKELGGEVRKVQWVGRNSAPDRIVMLPELLTAGEITFKPGETIWVELKAPGRAATFPKNAHEKAQHREHERMRKMGQRVEVVDSYERIEEILK